MTAPMHDVGKTGIPDSILLKPGPLTTAEFEIMKTHAEIGARMLRQAASSILKRAAEIALNHHERWDGGGYPRGLAGTDIPLPARLLSIADAYDAMSHDRVYRNALSEEEVLRNLRGGRGTQFDPELLDVFLRLLPEMQRIVEQNPDELNTDRAAYRQGVKAEWSCAKPVIAEANGCMNTTLLTSIIE